MVHLDFSPSRMQRQAGFTLIEMAVVVVIIGILMAAGLKVANVQRDAAAYSATRTKQEAIKQALINYLRNNRRLPCPDSGTGFDDGGNPGVIKFALGTLPDGQENRNIAVGNPYVTTVGCDTRLGVLPWATLGLARDAAIDGFGNFFTYHVSTSNVAPATADDWNITPVAPAAFATGVTGGITRQERFNNAAVPTPLAPDAVVVVVSHGKNGLGAYTIKGSQNVMPLVANALFVDEGENADGDAVSIQRDTNNDPLANGGAYDDVVVMLTPDDLLAPLLKEGTFKPTQAEVSGTLANIRDSVIVNIMGNAVPVPASCPIPASPGANAPPAGMAAIDPWGQPIYYSQGTLDLVGAPAASNAYVLWSGGTNRADDAQAGDDVVVTMTVGRVRLLLGNVGINFCN